MGNHGLPECVGKGDWNEAELVEYAADDGLRLSHNPRPVSTIGLTHIPSRLAPKRFMKFRSLFFMLSDMPWKITTDNLV